MKIQRTLLTLAIAAAAVPAVVSISTAQTPAPAPVVDKAAQEALAAKTKKFTELCQKLQQESAGVTEQDVRDVLTLGKELAKPFAANLAVKSYLTRNLKPAPALLLMAADNALAAGDFRAASSRYRTFLTDAPVSPESSEAYANLMASLLDFLGDTDGAYEASVRFGDKFRQSVTGRKYDTWFIAEARRRNDIPALANRLAAAFGDKLPLEHERILFWEDLDWLLASLNRPGPKQYDAAAGLRKLAPLVREGKTRPQRLNFYAAQLEFKANSAGKTPADLDKLYVPVVAAALECVKAAPTSASLSEVIFGVFNNENAPSGEEWAKQTIQKRQLFVSGFELLPDPEKVIALDSWITSYPSYFATAEQWSELGAKFPALFSAHESTRSLEFVVAGTDPAVFTKQAAFLRGQPSTYAAISNTLAAGPDLITQGAPHLFRNETWHLTTFGSPYGLLSSSVWNTYNAFPRDEKSKLPGDYWSKMVFSIGPELIAKTPAAFDRVAAQGYIAAAWVASGGADLNDKSKFAPHMHAFDWLPWTDKDRAEVFGPTYDQFKAWAQQLRANSETARKELDGATAAVAASKKALEDAQKKKAAAKPEEVAAIDNEIKTHEAALKTATDALTAADAKFKPFATAPAQITSLEAEFKAVMDPKINNIEKAPDALCKGIAQAVNAIGAKNRDAYIAAVRSIYPLVRDYEAKKTPYGAATMAFILAHRPQVFGTIDLQCEILADQLTMVDPARQNPRVRWIVSLIHDTRPDWRWGAVPAADAPKALQLNAVFAKALTDMANKGQFWPTLFEWFRNTRRGTGWFDQRVGQETFAVLIDKKSFVTSNYRPIGWPSAATTYMWFVINEFAPLSAKYAPWTYFDDMYVEELNANKMLDWTYWQYGKDEKKKIITAATKLLAASPTVPLGYNAGEKALNDRSLMMQWYWRGLTAEPAERDALVAASEAAYGKTRIDEFAQGRVYFSNATQDVSKAEVRKVYFEKLAAVIANIKQTPYRGSPLYIPNVGNIDPKTLTDAELAILIDVFRTYPASWPGGYGYENIIPMIQTALIARGRQQELVPLVPWFWRVAKDSRIATLQRFLAQSARDFADKEQYELATLYSGEGADVLGNELPDDIRTSLASVRSKSLVYVGGVVAVPRTDPRFPVFQAQADYLSGRTDAAWEGYLGHQNMVLSMFKDLDPTFTIWLIDRNTDARNFEAADSLAKQFLVWIEASPTGFEPEVRAGSKVAYANIAFARQEYPKARALYEVVASAQDLEGTQAKRDAELKIADVDRVTRQYDKAIERLVKLLRRRDRYIQTEASYQLAVVKFDQEEYAESSEYLDRVFAITPDHTNARILLGRVQLKMKKLIEASEVKVGLSSDQRFIVPGRPLKIDLEDRNLAVVGASTTIQVHVWTDTGDDETFLLFPFGDSKTKFSGQLPTKLGAAVKGDHTLQLVGKSTVFYELAKAGQQRDPNNKEGVTALTVASDAELHTSSGKILTKEELEERALERMIRDRLRNSGELGYDKALAMSTVRAEDEIKPGNPIFVRVIDLDRSIEGGKKNTVSVRAATASGDTIDAFTLTETEPYSGIFEGAIPTSSGQATAGASDSDDQSQPNFAISAGNYPAWTALPDGKRPKSFYVDLNDNVPLGKMGIVANVAGRKLKDFTVQVSLNGKQFTTVASWPKESVTWTGAPSLDVVRYIGNSGVTPTKLSDFESYVQSGYISKGVRKVTVKPQGGVIASAWGPEVDGLANLMGLGPSEPFIAHFQAAFYVAKSGVKTFHIDAKDKLKGVSYILAIDGQASDDPQRGGDPLRISRLFAQGAHKIEVYAFIQRGAPQEFKLMHDIPEAPFMAPCPPDMFDPVKEPRLKEIASIQAGKIKPTEDTSSFEVEFAPETRARVVRIIMDDFETDAPSIRRVTLTNAKGEAVLPTKLDFMELRRNQTLEIVPGDKVMISYNDEVTLGKNKRSLTSALSATYSDAEISACFVQYRNEQSDRTAEYIPMRRFRAGDPVNVFIKDPDMDVSDKLDSVSFQARTHGGKAITVTAIETDKHSGVFVGKIFPVSSNPQRETELQVADGEDIVLTYMDKENTNPGIPWERTFRIEQASFGVPELRVYEVTSLVLPENEVRAATASAQTNSRSVTERVDVTRTLVATRPDAAASTQPASTQPATKPAVEAAAVVPVDGPLIVEVTAPSLATSPRSTATIYVQTSTGRAKAGAKPGDAYDINVPGTIKMLATPNEPKNFSAPLGYRDVLVRGNRSDETALDEGRFTFVVPMQLGAVSDKTLVNEEPRGALREKTPLAIKGDDEIYIGVEYKALDGKTRWITRTVKLTSDPFFDVMDRRFQETVSGIHAGERLYFRVINKTFDISDEKDSLTIDVATASGEKRKIELTETFGHSGVFKGLVDLTYAGEKPAAKPAAKPGEKEPAKPAEEVMDVSLPVKYGDVLTATYALKSGDPLVRKVDVFKGADGLVTPFTKRFADPAIAVQTQFTVAEAYFELAKKHRELQQEELSRKEIAQGRKLLEEAVRDYPDTEFRAQADYLLANLVAEFAKDAKDKDTQRKQQQEAVTKFSNIVSNFPDSPYAPKSQYKKALLLEQMGEIDQAMEEYVKLSYRYPDNELVAETIARLGQYFLTKGKEFDEKAQAETDAIAKEKVRIQSRDMFRTSAQVFGRLAERFPSHALAGRTTVLSAQCYMRAQDYDRAIEIFKKVIEDTKADKDLVAQSMYWAGDCYMTKKDMINAYRMFKRVTWDFPDSQWARYARGRLTDEALVRVEEAEMNKK